jgi:hypothetical protein
MTIKIKHLTKRRRTTYSNHKLHPSYEERINNIKEELEKLEKLKKINDYFKSNIMNVAQIEDRIAGFIIGSTFMWEEGERGFIDEIVVWFKLTVKFPGIDEDEDDILSDSNSNPLVEDDLPF